MFNDDDKWQAMSLRAGLKQQHAGSIERFSRPLMITSALILAVVGWLRLL